MRIAVKIKIYLRAFKLVITGTKKPISVALMLAFKPPPYHIALISGQDFVSQDRGAVFEKINQENEKKMQKKLNREGLPEYTYEMFMAL